MLGVVILAAFLRGSHEARPHAFVGRCKRLLGLPVLRRVAFQGKLTHQVAGFAVYAISSDHNGALVHAAISAGNSHTTFVGLDAGELFPEVDLFFGLCGEAII